MQVTNRGSGNLSGTQVTLWALDSGGTVRPPAEVIGAFRKSKRGGICAISLGFKQLARRLHGPPMPPSIACGGDCDQNKLARTVLVFTAAAQEPRDIGPSH